MVRDDQQGAVGVAEPEASAQSKGMSNDHASTARDRMLEIRTRGLQWYAGGYGQQRTTRGDPFLSFGHQFAEVVSKELRVARSQPRGEKNFTWPDILGELYKYNLDLIVDPIFLTPFREAVYDLDVIQYGILTNYSVLAWIGSEPHEHFSDDGEPLVRKFLDHASVKEVFCLHGTAATEELEQHRQVTSWLAKLKATHLKTLLDEFKRSAPRRGRVSATTKGRIFVCDIGIAEKLKTVLPKDSNRIAEWHVPYSELDRLYGRRGGIPVGIPFRKTDEATGEWVSRLRELLHGQVEAERFLVNPEAQLSKLGVLWRPNSILGVLDSKGERKPVSAPVRITSGSSQTKSVLSAIGIPGHMYPLVEEVVQIPASGGGGYELSLGGVKGRGPTAQKAVEDLGVKFHKLFQTLNRIAPHDRSDADEQQWDQILSLVDIERYEEENPTTEPVIGMVRDILPTGLALEFFTHPDEGVVRRSFTELPPEAGAGSAGDWFEGDVRFYKGEMQWVTFRWRPPLKNEPAAWDSFDAPTEWGEE